jgi:hypothetical protein
MTVAYSDLRVRVAVVAIIVPEFVDVPDACLLDFVQVKIDRPGTDLCRRFDDQPAAPDGIFHFAVRQAP